MNRKWLHLQRWTSDAAVGSRRLMTPATCAWTRQKPIQWVLCMQHNTTATHRRQGPPLSGYNFLSLHLTVHISEVFLVA